MIFPCFLTIDPQLGQNVLSLSMVFSQNQQAGFSNAGFRIFL
jgi:hypothetical protein